MKTKSTFKYISALVLIAGGLAFSAVGCMAETPDQENTAEAEQAVSRGGTCNMNPDNCDSGLQCICNAPPCLFGICCDDAASFCNGVCKDLDSDPNNCGSCGHKCPATQICFTGVCEPHS